MSHTISKAEFDAVYAIMQDSFPESEYRPYKAQLALTDREDYHILTYREGETLLAFAAVYELEGYRFVEHLATTPAARGRGIGKALLSQLATGDKPLCLEVEPPETDLACRRIAFYRRQGFVLHRYPYAQPPMAEGRPWVPLMLMVQGKELTVPELAQLKDLLYTKVYHRTAEGAPL